MSARKSSRSFLEELADYDNPAPPEFDPEQDTDRHGVTRSSSADEGSVDADGGREHYVNVGKSKLRGSDGVDLGVQYEGASISRDGLQDDEFDEDEDEPFGIPGEGFDSNEEGSEADKDEVDEAVEDFGTDGDNDDDDGDIDEYGQVPKAFKRRTSPSGDTEEEEFDDEIDENSDSDRADEQDGTAEVDSIASSPPPDENDNIKAKSNRAAIRRMMADERKNVAASLSAAAKADIAKGKAIKQQRSTFDSLLNTRIKLQKALIAANSMVIDPSSSASENQDAAAECASASRAAEEAALGLWKSLSSLRESLDTSSVKRPLSTIEDSSSQSLWDEATNFETNVVVRRRNILTKWSQRTNPNSTLQPQNRLSQAPVQASLTSVLDRQLSGDDMERALKRTRVARSCAPLQAASKTAVEDERIYDDADFYTMLLRELVDRRMDDSRTPSTALATNVVDMLPSQAELKVKKQVDTKASKGRKMRYTVHEKLENFMAADDRGSWGERQRAELFGSLLGRKVDMGENEEDERSEDEEAKDVDGLKLFGR